jgi:hypothetical protein
MRSTRFAVASLLLAAGIVLVLPASAQAATLHNLFAAEGVVGSHTLDDTNGTFTVGTDGHSLDVSAFGSGLSNRVIFSSAAGSELTVGTFPVAEVEDGSHGRIYLSLSPGWCDQPTGTVTLLEFVHTGNSVSSMHATYQVTCAVGDVRGELAWQTSADFGAVRASATSLEFQGLTAEYSTPQTLTFTSVGTLPVTFGVASFDGTMRDIFAVATNTCSGSTVDIGQSCTIAIRALSPDFGQWKGTLDLADGSTLGHHTVLLTYTSNTNVKGSYFSIQPQRFMDTRTGKGAPKAPIKAHGVVHLTVTGRSGVPVGAAAVVMNVTVTAPTSRSFLTVYPTGVTRPTASSLNFPRGWTGANLVTVAVGAGGQVDIYNEAGSVQVIVDVQGFYGADNAILNNRVDSWGEFQPVRPQRLVDTRVDFGTRVPSGGAVLLAVDYGDAVNSHIKALAVNVTAVSPTGAGYLTAWDGFHAVPSTSTLNFTAGKVVPNMAIVPTAPCWDCPNNGYPKPGIAIYASRATHVLVDIVGLYDDSTLPGGLRFKPMAPARIVDTRIGLGAPSALGPGATATIATPTTIADADTQAVAMNLTAVVPSTGTFLTVWPDGYTDIPRPTVSNLNPAAGQTVPNAAVTLIGPAKAFNIYNSVGTVNVVVDVVGTFWSVPPASGAAATPLSGMRSGAIRPHLRTP